MYDKLTNFLGFGKLGADFWFMGMEEGGGSKENIRARLNIKENPAVSLSAWHMAATGILCYTNG
jgi:hypothetical protein